MNCHDARNELLGLEEPARPADPELRSHLAGCAACRDWTRRLVRLERAAGRLPVPDADSARDALLRTIVSSPAEAPRETRKRPSVAMRLGSLILDPYASPHRRVGAGLVAGVAASLLLFVAGWWAWYQHDHANSEMARATAAHAVEPLIAELDRRKVPHRPATTPRERVQVMAGVAGQLQDKTRVLAREGATEDMSTYAGLYGRVIREGIVTRARALPAGDRRTVLAPIVRQLSEEQGATQRLALETDMPAVSKKALEEMALAAAEGGDVLRELYGDEGS